MGHSYSQIIRNGRGDITALYPLMPEKMTVDRGSYGNPYYKYNSDKQGSFVFCKDEIFHIVGLGFDGLIGHSPIAMAKNAIGLSIAAEEYGSSFFSIGIMPAFIVFCGTWVTYMIVEPIISKITSKTRIVFFAGHIGITILLGIMSVITKQSALFIVLWLITGFGGGTVYTISDMAKKYECYDKESMTIAENIGHKQTFLLLTIVVKKCIMLL